MQNSSADAALQNRSAEALPSIAAALCRAERVRIEGLHDLREHLKQVVPTATAAFPNTRIALDSRDGPGHGALLHVVVAF